LRACPRARALCTAGTVEGDRERRSGQGATEGKDSCALLRFDDFHELILSEEFKRIGCYGLSDGLLGGASIGLPPLINFGSDELKARIVPGRPARCLGAMHRRY
jgi:hypothetical protein